MKKPIFTGAGVAIITPMFEDGSINYAELGRLIDWHVENKTDAIIICGTTGESATMTDEEHAECIHFAVCHTAGRIPVIAGAGSNDTAYAVWLSREAKEAGADALLHVTPYYNKCSQTGLVRHFNAIADATDLPVILYNVPSRTGVSIKPSTYAELAKHPNIVATKEACGDISAIALTRALCGDELGVYSGNDDQIVPVLSLGGLGVISVLSNICPATTHDICQLWFEGKTAQSAHLQIDFMELIGALFCDVNPIPIKEAVRLLGFSVGPCRLPLDELGVSNRKLLTDQMKKHHLV
ncbi:MAG: 4-hydroxy-tetrahydrodipicolinate synthase [Oscillospiraceae bacterium]